MESAVTTDAGSMFQLSITLRLNEFARTFNFARLLNSLKGWPLVDRYVAIWNSFSLFTRSMLFKIL